MSKETCDVPPEGWWCSREKGHEPPCAARPINRRPITHVAMRFRDQIWSLPRPYRHHHIIRMICYLDPEVDTVDAYGRDQGFLDETGQYLTRRQAEISAHMNGQIKNNGNIIGSELTSEDLW